MIINILKYHKSADINTAIANKALYLYPVLNKG